MKNLSGNNYTETWAVGGWVYKRQHAHLAENEWWCLNELQLSGYVPLVERVDINTIRTTFVPGELITDPGEFMSHYQPVLTALTGAGIRHGDLSIYAVRISKNKPVLIDFAESRMACDPRADKRARGDAYWLEKTMEQLCGILPYKPE